MFNFMKTAAVVAALGTGTTAAADGWFGLQETVEDNGSITLDLIRTDAAGFVAIYDYSTGEFGEMLGMAELNAGANADVPVNLELNSAETLAAVIFEGEIGDPAIATNWIELDVSEDS
ncbi:DUF7282 domain-containing protein [Yoonia litorea]|uniref:DUF7282 domain-containing protein n=1 Tax=Yoonia litorea TaxID=1123755 RepID=A0A1I6MVG6_9RHOB|nr:hypothetical protein [Yoonia litorea]SFS19644.1 hypothetical protein SAMN05444714_2286 [Yoonia litorea]